MYSKRRFVLMLCLHFHFATVSGYLKSKGDGEAGRMKRAAGVQAPQGKCLSFKWERIHGSAVDYVCCNNCGDLNQNCLGTTYRSGSSGYYCGRCGENNQIFARTFSSSFSCGGCDGQTEKANICRARYISTPSSCWLFRGCFEKACRVHQGYGQSNCFNGVCDVGESVDSCPADCCSKKNPENCTLVSGKCPLKCCGERSCCKKEDHGTAGHNGGKIAGATIGSLVILCCIFGGSKKVFGSDNAVHPSSESNDDSDCCCCVVTDCSC